MKEYKIVILDSHKRAAFVTQRGLEWGLGPAATIGLAASPADAWGECTTTDVDLLLIDPTDYGEVAWTLLRLLRESCLGMSIVVLAAHCTPRVLRRARELGIMCMPKTHEMTDICCEVRSLLGVESVEAALIELGVTQLRAYERI